MKETLFRDNPGYPIWVTNQNGSTTTDKRGRKYLDMMTGYSLGNAGWNNPVIRKAIQNLKGPTYVAPDFYYQRWQDLSEKLVGLMPNPQYTCFRTTGGTEAVEVALKTAKAHNGRQKFVALDGAYHGQSLACLALVGLHENKFGPYGNQYIRLPRNWNEAKEKALNAIEKGDVCAYISEPIICNWGIMVPPKGFLEDIRKACIKTDTVFIMDEVMTGFGRTGEWFGYEHFGLTPDIVTIAKGFSSGHAPIGATIVNTKIAEGMRFDFSNYSSFGWHPLGVEAAIANIDYIQKKKLVEKSKKDGKYLMDQVKDLGKVEGKGLCMGLEIRNDQFHLDCLKKGLITNTYSGRTLLLPPLTISRKEIDQAVNIMRKVY